MDEIAIFLRYPFIFFGLTDRFFFEGKWFQILIEKFINPNSFQYQVEILVLPILQKLFL